jgi:hypothetical protein
MQPRAYLLTSCIIIAASLLGCSTLLIRLWLLPLPLPWLLLPPWQMRLPFLGSSCG